MTYPKLLSVKLIAYRDRNSVFTTTGINKPWNLETILYYSSIHYTSVTEIEDIESANLDQARNENYLCCIREIYGIIESA